MRVQQFNPYSGFFPSWCALPAYPAGCQLDPGWRVVASIGQSADRAIDPCPGELTPQGGAHDEVIDAQPCVTSVRVAPVFPEGVETLLWVECAQGVDPALLEESLVGGAHFGTEEGVIAPALGRIDVEVGGNGVVVARQDDGDLLLDQELRAREEPFEPPELE